MSDNREILRVIHQIISSEFKVIASMPFPIASDRLDISTPHEYADICYSVRKLVA